MSYRMQKTKTYKWALRHCDDDESETRWFKTKSDAVFHVLAASGYWVEEESVHPPFKYDADGNQYVEEEE